MWASPTSRSSVAAARRRTPARGRPAGRRRRHRRARDVACARLGTATCAIRGCACCSTATPPTPAPTPAARPRRWPPCPYVEQRFGVWYVDGGLRRLATAVAERAVERGAAVRTGAAVSRDRGRRRPGRRGAAGRRRPAARRRRRRQRRRGPSTATCCPAGLRRRPARDRPRRLVGVRRCCSALRGRTPGLAHHTVLFPEDYDAEFDAVFGGARPPVTDPTVYVSAPDDPARAPRRGRGVVRAGQRRPARARAAGVDWDSRAWPTATPTGCSSCSPRAGSTSATGCAGASYRTPADLERATGSPGGSIYGTSSNGPARRSCGPERLPRARALPGRRLGAPRRRAAAGHAVGRDRRRPDRPGLTRTSVGALRPGATLCCNTSRPPPGASYDLGSITCRAASPA